MDVCACLHVTRRLVRRLRRCWDGLSPVPAAPAGHRPLQVGTFSALTWIRTHQANAPPRTLS